MVLQESDKETILKKFVGLADNVELIVFSQEIEMSILQGNQRTDA